MMADNKQKQNKNKLKSYKAIKKFLIGAFILLPDIITFDTQ